MNPLDYEFLRKLLKARSGLALSADKQYLLESRLLPLARREGLRELHELIDRLRGRDSERLTAEVVEAMTTNESFFLRDKAPFESFRDVIMPELLAARADKRHIRIWCAACSTGQEPYSLAMILDEMRSRLQGWRVEILASDISNEVLERARAGSYSQFEVQRGLPITQLLKHFEKDGERWQISPQLRGMVEFRQHNLLQAFNHFGRFDVIFCRNVLIYFDRPTKAEVLERLARAVERDGYLVLGGAETVVGLSDAWKPMPRTRCISQPQDRAKSEPVVTPRPVARERLLATIRS